MTVADDQAIGRLLPENRPVAPDLNLPENDRF